MHHAAAPTTDLTSAAVGPRTAPPSPGRLRPRRRHVLDAHHRVHGRRHPPLDRRATWGERRPDRPADHRVRGRDGRRRADDGDADAAPAPAADPDVGPGGVRRRSRRRRPRLAARVLLAARFFTALATGAFWAVAGWSPPMPPGQAAASRALGVVEAGGTLATVLGVPLGAFAAQSSAGAELLGPGRAGPGRQRPLIARYVLRLRRCRAPVGVDPFRAVRAALGPALAGPGRLRHHDRWRAGRLLLHRPVAHRLVGHPR